MPDVITDYIPIACGFHDRLEHWAVRRDVVDVIWLDGSTENRRSTAIVDVFAKEGADWVRLEGGDVIRADHIVSIDGVVRPNTC